MGAPIPVLRVDGQSEMGRKSSIDRLPEDVRGLIEQLHQRGWTIDQIREKLSEMLDEVPSRSAIGRKLVGMQKVRERLTRSRTVAEALAKELGDAPGSEIARLNVELMHSAILDLYMKFGDGETVDADGMAALQGNPEGMMMLCKALDHLGRASKSNVDYILAVEKRAAEKARAEAAVAVETVGKERGISASTIEAIKASIFGVQQK